MRVNKLRHISEFLPKEDEMNNQRTYYVSENFIRALENGTYFNGIVHPQKHSICCNKITIIISKPVVKKYLILFKDSQGYGISDSYYRSIEEFKSLVPETCKPVFLIGDSEIEEEE